MGVDGQQGVRTDRDSAQIHNKQVTPIYVLDVDFNLLDTNPEYPQNPKTFGEKVRKARMDRGLFLWEFADLVGTTMESVINWESRGIMPHKGTRERVEKFFGKEVSPCLAQ